MKYINNLYLDLALIEDDLRTALNKYLKSDYVRSVIDKEIYIIAEDTDLNTNIKTPSIDISLSNDGTLNRTQEDINIQVYSNITLEVNVYTSGSLKNSENKKLMNLLTRFFQANQKLDNYYSYGFKIMQERQLSSLLEDRSRRLARFKALIDNRSKKIHPH